MESCGKALRMTLPRRHHPVSNLLTAGHAGRKGGRGTHGLVLCLLVLVALLVGGSLVLVGLALGVGESLPLVTEHLADLAWVGVRWRDEKSEDSLHTEGDARVLFADLVTVVVGEEHVGRQATLGSIGV